MTIRLFVVDDHAIVRRGIVQVLCEHPEVQIIAEASDYTGLRNELKKHGEPDVLVMDVGLPGKNGIDILKALRDEHPKLKVLIVSMYPEDQYAVRAFRAGAFGYLNKASAPEKLLEALAQVVSGPQVRHARDRTGVGRKPEHTGRRRRTARKIVGSRISNTEADRVGQAAIGNRRGTGAESEDGQRLSRAHS